MISSSQAFGGRSASCGIKAGMWIKILLAVGFFAMFTAFIVLLLDMLIFLLAKDCLGAALYAMALYTLTHVFLAMHQSRT